MGELGEMLRKAREAKGLSLAQVEEATKIRSTYLQALEEEQFQRLPAPVYVKGFLKNYALYLGLDAQQVLAFYHEPQTTAATTPVPMMLNEPLEAFTPRRLWPVGLLFIIVLAAVIGWWGYQRYYGTTPFIQPTVAPTATYTLPLPSPTMPPPTATPSPTTTPRPTVTLTPTTVGLELSTEVIGQRAWLLVQADGQQVFAGILEPGAKKVWTARERIVLRSGNAGAVRVTLNGQALGLFGELGQVVEKEWTAPGVPTRTAAPTTTP